MGGCRWQTPQGGGGRANRRSASCSFPFRFAWEAAVGFSERKVVIMDSTMIVRIVSGVLFVIVLVVLVQRRRTNVQ